MSNKSDVEMMHAALDKLMNSVTHKGHCTANINNVTLSKRWNPHTGHHVHASCSVKLKFDESVSDTPIVEKY